MQGKKILRDKFNKTLKTMKTRKLPSIDGMTTEFILNASTETQDEHLT